jgi:hypothetical protein
MKQLLFPLLFLPCLALAQYPANAGQKITLGEQTTADGLVYRGLAADTTRKPSVDTMAYILLDTATNIIWQYKKATSNAWLRVGGSISSGLTGTLPVENGGTGTTTISPNNYLIRTNSSGIFDTSAVYEAGGNVGIGVEPTSISKLDLSGQLRIRADGYTTSTLTPNLLIVGNTNNTGLFTGNIPPSLFVVNRRLANISLARIGFNAGDGEVYGYFIADAFGAGLNNDGLPVAGIGMVAYSESPLLLITDNLERMRITSAGEVWIGYTADNGAYPLQVNGQIFATNATIETSDEKFKENILPLSKGLEIVNKLKPVTFNFISDTENNFSEYEEVGFIAQDVDRALSTETFAKSIVKQADDSDPNSTMGIASGNLIPILVKAIQEQQALIKALEQRILTLENK